jgi:hypothetical protein
MGLNIAETRGTIFRPENKGKYVQANFSTGRKQKDGSYRNSNFVTRFIGDAFVPAQELQEKDRITVTNGFLENVWDKANKKNWLTLIVFNFEFADGRNATAQDHQAPAGFDQVDEEDNLPF